MNIFKRDFVFGTATSSYQIEGAYNTDARANSIWDVFSKTPGKVQDGDTGDIACDHYNRYEEDLKNLKNLGVNSYRFSISWPRIFPKEGVYNPKGMEFYKNIIKLLKSYDIKPCVTLYHWDLPYWAYEKGGWLSRDVINWFKEYAKKCFEELGNDVDFWITHNEPFCSGFLGYFIGNHAPGHKNLEESLIAIHHILLSHGEAVKIMRSLYPKSQIGITLNLTPVESNSTYILDELACNNSDGWQNRWFLDPVFKSKYPLDMMNLFSKEVKSFEFIKHGDLETISTPTDFLGVNYYSSGIVEYNNDWILKFKGVEQDVEKTEMGWYITPEKLKELINRLRKEYTDLPIYITENGAAFNDFLSEDNKVHDDKRVKFLEDHLKIIAQLNEEQMNIAGYFLWSFMDNFEWAHGYSKRFGIVYVDYDTQKRIRKDSFYRYKQIIENHSL